MGNGLVLTRFSRMNNTLVISREGSETGCLMVSRWRSEYASDNHSLLRLCLTGDELNLLLFGSDVVKRISCQQWQLLNDQYKK